MEKKQKEIYTLVYGDLFSSRKLSNRSKTSSRFGTILKKVNSHFKDRFIVPLKKMRGIDEIAAIPKRLSDSFEICRTLNEELFPLRIRFVITQGEIETGLRKKDIAEMGGQIFHDAGDLMTRLKKIDKYYIFNLYSASDGLNLAVTAFAHLIANWGYGITESQNEILKLYRRYGKQKIVAQKLGISQQAVSDSLKASGFDDIRFAEEALISLLREYNILEE